MIHCLTVMDIIPQELSSPYDGMLIGLELGSTLIYGVETRPLPESKINRLNSLRRDLPPILISIYSASKVLSNDHNPNFCCLLGRH